MRTRGRVVRAMRGLMATLLVAASVTACRRAAKAPGAAPAATPASRAAPAGGSAAPAPAGADSVRGTLDVVGADPAMHLVLRTSGGAVVLTGPRAAPLAPLAGLELVVWGRAGAAPVGALPPAAGARGLEVARVLVRAQQALAALDGVLELDGERGVLRLTEDGSRRALASVPPGLRALAGRRVFWVGPTDRAPQAYGLVPEGTP